MFAGRSRHDRRLERKMHALSARLVSGVKVALRDGSDTCILSILEGVLQKVHTRPVLVKRVAFPPGTLTGMWLALEDMDVVAIGEADLPDAIGSVRELVVAGHELWHMMGEDHGDHGSGLGPGRRLAARAPSAPSTELRQMVGVVLAAVGRNQGEFPSHVLTHAARAHLDDRREAEAELFGLRLATELRALKSSYTSPAVDDIANRIASSLGQGAWA